MQQLLTKKMTMPKLLIYSEKLSKKILIIHKLIITLDLCLKMVWVYRKISKRLLDITSNSFFYDLVKLIVKLQHMAMEKHGPR